MYCCFVLPHFWLVDFQVFVGACNAVIMFKHSFSVWMFTPSFFIGYHPLMAMYLRTSMSQYDQQEIG
jgi:hypothetical protein